MVAVYSAEGASRQEGFGDVTASDDVDVPRWERDNPQWRAVMSDVTGAGLDLAKIVFRFMARTQLVVLRKGAPCW